MLHNHSLSAKHPWKFQDIEWKIDTEGTNTTKLANVIAKYRKEMIDVLKSGEAEEKDDEDTLNKLIEKLKDKKWLLETDLWKTSPCKIDLSENTDIVNFWKSIVDGSNPKLKWKTGTNLATPTDIEWIIWNKDNPWRIQEALEKIQFLHFFLEDDWSTWDRKDKWKLFKGASTEMTNISKTLKNPLISTVLNETKDTKVESDIKSFVNSVKRTKWNAFYIQSEKLYTDEQRETAIRISLYLYCVYKIVSDSNKVTKELCDDINEKLDQIINEEIPKIKWLHNTKVELWYLEPEYETLRDLNVKKKDENLWEKDLWAWGFITETRNLKADFENWIAVDLDKYSLKTSEIEVKDSTGNLIPVILNDWMIDFTELSANKGIRLSSDILLNIWWLRLKIWKIFIDNNTLHQLDIKFDDETTIKAAAAASWITLPSFPLDFSFNLKWTKKVSNGLDGCYASLKKKYIAKLKVWWGGWVLVPKNAPREWAMTISNVDQVNRAIAEREADEELRERYRNVGWNVLDRANLFLRRNFIKDKIVRKKMKWKDWFDWSDSSQSAAHRHQIEEQEKLSDNLNILVDIDEVNYPQTRAKLDDLINDFTWKNSVPTPREWGIDEKNFKIQFEDILKKAGKGGSYDTWSPNIMKIIKSGNLRSLSSNIMMQAKQFQAHQKMVYEIHKHILDNPWESDIVFDAWCRWKISNYINTYDDIPDFLHQMKLSIDNVDDIKTLKASTGALATIQAQSLKYRLQILDGGEEAYNVKRRWWFLTRVWRRLDDPTESIKFFDKHPHLKQTIWRILWGAKLAVIPTTLLLAGAWPLATAWIIGGYSGLTTLIKKKSHYEKENRSYQRMQATNLTDYRNKRTNLANEVAWMKWHEGRFWWEKKRIRDQYNDYVLTTHDQLELTSDLIAKIKAPLKKWWPLTAGEKDSLGSLLADWLARLDFHKETWQNFLWSDNTGVAEKEYRQLQNAIIWWTLRLGIDVSDLKDPGKPYKAYYDTTMKIIRDWTGKEYNTQWYEKAMSRFKRRSRKKAWVWALKAWAISAWLSYLASSLASWTNTTTTTTENLDGHIEKVWWEYNLWDVQEHLFVSWDVNPAMNDVINSSTLEISQWSLYSSVDAARCSAEFWAKQLAQAQADLASTLSNPIISNNSDLVSAINNYVADATSKIWTIPWLSAWNHDLAIARAIEAAKEWILEPIISSWNTNIKVPNVTCLSWTDWGISTSVVSQSYRNMGIMSLDYIQKWAETVVEHTARAIPIPTPGRSNTFWAPKSDPK